jgi:hypothetical protein
VGRDVRVEGWESLLAAHLQPTEFVWGKHDCALWAADWVCKATGNDFGADWRGQYATEDEAQELMQARGFSGPEGIADAHLEPVPVALAHRGDIMLHPTGALGICAGAYSYFLTGRGLTRIPTLLCKRAWRV